MNPDTDFLPPQPDAKISSDFQEEVISRIHQFHRRRQRVLNLVVFGLVLTTSFYYRRTRDTLKEIPVKQDQRVASAAKGVDWLVEAQNDDGTWDTGSLGGHAAFADGVSALATLALLNAPNPVNREVLEKAVHALERSLPRQQRQTLEGPQFYNWVLTLHTLSEIEKQMPSASRKVLLEKSFTDLLKRQQVDGGWGYLDQQPMGYIQSSTANSAVTWWMCQLLNNRPSLKLPGAELALTRGQQWLSERRLPSGEIAYKADKQVLANIDDALFWMFALPYLEEDHPTLTQQDAYRDFFRFAIAQNAFDLKSIQNQQGENGAWTNPKDRWWRAGGQVYLTALSVLSQVPNGV